MEDAELNAAVPRIREDLHRELGFFCDDLGGVYRRKLIESRTTKVRDYPDGILAVLWAKLMRERYLREQAEAKLSK
jgi:hypothetical protein